MMVFLFLNPSVSGKAFHCAETLVGDGAGAPHRVQSHNWHKWVCEHRLTFDTDFVSYEWVKCGLNTCSLDLCDPHLHLCEKGQHSDWVMKLAWMGGREWE